MAGVIRYDFQGGIGNMPQFIQQLKGIGAAARSSYQTAATAPVANLRMPNVSMGNIVTTINAYDRTLRQSGQVFHQYVVGYKADMKQLEVSGRNLGTGGMSFTGRNGRYGTYGTSVSSTGKAGVYGKDLTPVYETFGTGKYVDTIGDYDKILRAQKALVPVEQQLEQLERRRVLAATGYAAKLETARTYTTQLEDSITRNASKYAALTSGVMAHTGMVGGVNQSWLAVQDKEVNKLAKTFDPKTGQFVFPFTPTGAPDTDAAIEAAGRNASAPDARIQRALSIIRKLDPLEQTLTNLGTEYQSTAQMIQQLSADEAKSGKRFEGRRQQILNRSAGLRIQLDQALQSTPPISKDLDYFLQNSKDFRKQFLRQTGVTTPYVPAPSQSLLDKAASDPNAAARVQAISRQRENFSSALLAKGITPESIKVQTDYERGVRTISGASRDARGAMGSWTASIDNNNRSVERLGGSLRGTGGFLRQTGRDFQKVIEWTVATTLVFGALGATIGSIGKITEVNKDLQRFSLTAQASGEETKRAFDQISKIAYDTATPLQELTSVMDDIALATRRAGQTSAEWKIAINSLAESVGILTNLTGVDTVRATDLLSAAYKQLQIAPEALIGVLNKVTAVAGGNAQAIEDIVAALGSVSEAAKSAGLDIDQQIAAVQTISQVTNKSATEVAVSFKNLFGSLSSTGSEKALAKVGIDLRNAKGEVRDFLEVYKEIYDAKISGQISEGQLQEVIKGIAGGPRRAPDAAALVSNMPLIYEQLTKAQNASNDALIANAKVLDTNSAKLQQLRTQFDTALINQFTESVNKLVAVFYSLGSAVGSVIGTGPSNGLSTILIQFALIAAATVGLGKIFGVLRGVFSGVVKDFAKFGVDEGSIFARSRLAEFANPTLYKPNVIRSPSYQGRPYTSDPRIGPSSVQYVQGPMLPGGVRFYSNPVPDHVTNTVRPDGMHGPFLPGGVRFYSQEPRNQFTLNQGASLKGRLGTYGRYAGAKLIGTPQGRLGLAAGAGLAIGGALAGIGSATKNLQGLATAGQTVGLTLAMLGGPVGIAAGGTLAVVSTALGFFAEQQVQAAEKAKSLRFAVLDNIKVLNEDRKALDEQKKSQEESSSVIETLSKKRKLTADETNKLATAQENYITTAFKISDINAKVIESTDKLIAQIPQLGEKYQGLIDILNSSGKNLDPAFLKTLSTSLASDILNIQAPGSSGQLHFASPTAPSSAIINQKPSSSNGTPWSANQTLDFIRSGDSQRTINLLRGYGGPTTGQTVNEDILRAMQVQLSLVDDTVRETSDYKEAMARLVEIAQSISAPESQLFNNINAIVAQTTAQTSLGILNGDQAKNAMARSKAMEDIKTYLPTYVDQQKAAARQAPNRENAARNTSPDIVTSTSEFLFGKNGNGGFLGGPNGPSGDAFDTDKAKEFFKILTLIDPAFRGLADSEKQWNAATYMYWHDQGVEIEALKKDAEDLGYLYKELQDSIAASVTSGQASLYEDLLGLRARKAGGEFNGKDGNPGSADYTKEQDQIYSLISAYGDLGAAFETNASYLEEFKAKLGSIHALQGIQLQDTDQLLPSLINYAKQMGLTGHQIDKLTSKVIALLNSMRLIDGLKAQFGLSVSLPTSQFKTFLQGLKTTLTVLGKLSFLPGGGGALATISKAVMSQVDAAIAQLDSSSALSGQINNLLSSGSGTSFSGGGSKGGGGGGGGGSTNKPSLLDIPEEFKQSDRTVASLLKEAIANAKGLQSKIPGETKANRREIVAILDGTKKLLQTKGIGSEYLRRAMEELAAQIKKQNDLLSKADTIRRIRVGNGDFAAIANVPVNSTSGISMAGNNAINITLNLNGTVLTPAQFDQFANQIAAALKRQLTN